MEDNQAGSTHGVYALCFANNKGGVGKTTSAAAIAYLFATEGQKKVLLIDADAQTNLSTQMKARMDGRCDVQSAVMSKVANAKILVSNFIVPTQYENIAIIPGNRAIEGKTFTTQVDTMRTETGINPWQEVIDSAKELHLYDTIIVDTHPSTGTDTLLPAQACDYIISPMGPDDHSVSGFLQMYFKIIQSRRNASTPKILGCFFNRIKKNTSNSKQYVPSAKKLIPQKALELTGKPLEGIIFNTEIRDSEDARKAINFQCAVTERYNKKNIGIDFKKLYKEIVEAIENG